MQDLGLVRKQNRQEAYDLLKQAGGKVEFATLELMESTTNKDELLLPWVVIEKQGCVRDYVYGVLAMRSKDNYFDIINRNGEKETLVDNVVEFLLYDCVNKELIGWWSSTSALNESENEAFLFLEKWIKNHK